jgi:hypothetical protein
MDTPAMNASTQDSSQLRLKPKHLFAHEILPPHHLKKLKMLALRAYESVWNSCHRKGQDWCWMTDAELIRRIRIRPDQLPTIKSELSASGLVSLFSGVAQVRYTLLDPDKEFEMMFPEPPQD